MGVLLTGDLARAYVLPADFIMRMLAERRRRMNIKDLSIQLNTEISEHSVEVEEHLYLKAPERMRRVRQDEETTIVEVQREGRHARGSEKALQRMKGPPSDPLAAMLMPAGEDVEQMQERLLRTIAALGIDTKTTWLGRFEDRVCYVIGAHNWKANANQLWIDKETFLPVRLVQVSGKEGKKSRRELRWLEYGSAVTGDWFPRVLEVYVDGERIERAEVAKIELNKKVPETLFDLP
jgi:outer membrane lipoprotein-sorting protein